MCLRSQFTADCIDTVAQLFLHALFLILQGSKVKVPQYEDLPPGIRDSLEVIWKGAEKANEEDYAAQQHPSDVSNSEQLTTLEAEVLDVLAKVSGKHNFARGRQTTIYQLGLDSISALQVAFSIRQKFAVDLNAADVLECPTCESLAAKITDLRGNGKDNSAITDATSDLFATVAEAVGAAVDHSIVETILPCTPLQEGMLVESLKSNGHKYLNFFQLRLTPTVDVGQIRQSLLRLPEAHPILRTVIIPVECSKVSYAMLTHAGPHLRLPVSVKEEGDFDREEWMLAVRRRVVELSRLPLWDAVILSNDGSTTIELALHHVLYDAHSLSRLLRDLAQATEGRPVAPSPDLAEAVRGSFRGFYSIRHEAEPFWKGLASRAVPNQFPTLISTTSNVSQTSSVSRPMRLSRSAVQEATSSLGVTIQAVMQSAWVRILSAYHGENAVVFGTVLSARSTSLVTDTVFPLINTVPVVFTNKPSNRELLDDMMALTVSLYRHQHAPLTLVKQWLGCADRTLFDTVVVYQPRRPEEQFDRCHMEIFEDQSSTDYTLSVELEDDGSSDMAVRVTFLDSVIPRGQAEFLARQFDACFSHLLQCPDASEKDLLDWDISVFSVVSPRIPELPSDVALLHDFVESSAKASPDSTALVFAERLTDSKHDMCQWSYRQLDERGNQVANLISGAVRLGDVVAVQFEKRPEAYFSILGILKVGCSFVALDPGAPPARRKYILEDSKAVALLVGKHGQRTLGFEAEIPVLEIVEEALDQLPSSIPVLERAVTPNDTCYILYTSGTTGMPKGCMITHDNAVQAMLAFQHLFAGHWDRTSRWLQFASFHFDVSVLEQYWSWSVGITLVSAPRDVMLEDIAYTISALDITHIDLTPSLARLVQPENAPSLCRGIFITGGEQLRQEVLDSWGKTGVIYNAYGPTEATIGVTMYQNVPQNARTTNIGSAFPNVGAYVLSVGTELPVLRGGIGELCVAGRLVGRGYVNRDELTASRFPTLSRFGQRVYRTGDLVRLLDDGSFDFLGRADDQVKLRGQRLEISEVNHAIKDSVPDISDVVTTVVDKLNGDGAQLVSFVTMKGDTRGDRELRIILEGTSNLARDILHACRHRLPNYMVPTFVLRIPYIPLSPNNKADIRVLKDLFRALPREQLLAVSSSQAQSTSAACVTASTVIQCLRDEGFVDSDNIAVDANVFELGVDSISVLRLARRLVRAGLPHTSPATILQRPRIRDLAEALEHSTATAISSSQQQNGLVIRACFHQYQSLACHSLGVTPDAIEYIAPCSALQQGIISRALQSQHQGLYFNAFRFLSQDGVSASHLQSAWERVTDRFAILRTNFISTDDGHVQVALKKISRHILRLDASSLHEIDGIFENAKRQWIAENSGTIAAPFEVIIVQCGNIVEFQVHLFHGIYDGVAFDLLMERLSAEYQGKVSSRPVPTFLDALAAGPLQDFSFSRNFWEDHMLGSTLVRFPRMHEVTLETASITATRTMPFDLESARLKLRTTHHAVVQALWVSLLQKFAPEVNITGVLLSGRSIPMDGVEDVVGPLFNTVPFHWRLRRSTSWNKLVQDCHAFVSSAISFAHVPLRLIQKWTTHGHAAFDTLFSFRRQRKSQGPDPPLWTQTGNESIADYPLACEAELADDGTLMVTLVAQTAIADSSVLTDMLDYLESSTNRLCSDPDSEVEHGGSGRIQPCVPSGGNDAATNGSPRSSSPPLEVTPSTSWDATSLAIREEIASIAGVPPSTIREDVPILELGLDSIDAIKLSSRLRKRGLVATSTNLMQWRTVAKIRQHCSIHQMSSASADNFHRSSPLQAVSELLVGQIGGKADDLERALPTTPLQDIMVAEMISSNFVSYFTHETLELGRHVDTDRLISAWHRIVAANPILRTSFTAVTDIELDHAYCQLVRSTDKSIIRHRELLSLDDIHTVLTEARDAADEANGHSALVQLSFVTVGDRRFLILSLAHALYDGWSIQLLHRDIQAAYAGSISRRPFWERHISRVLGSATQDAADFWTNYLKDITPTLILKRQQRTFERTQKLHRREIISQVRLTAARKFCKAQSVTLQTLGMACWSAVLAHRVRCVDVAFGVVLSGRETEEDQETMFPMMNTVIARCLLHGSASQYLRYVQHNTAQILQFQHFPLRKAQRLARRSGGPIFNTLFIHQTSPPSDNVELPEDGRVLRPVDSEASLDFPVCVEIEAKGDTLVWRVGCSGSYLSEHESDETVANLDKVLRFIVRNPDASFLTLSGSQAKVCALPSFVIRSQESTNGVHEPDANGGAGKPQQWSLNELPVVEALARISGHDISAISRHNNVYHLGLDSISVIKVSALLRKDGVLLKPDDMLTAESINELFLRVAHNSLLSDQKQDDQTVAESNKHASLPALDTVGLLQRLQLSWEHVERVIPATPMQVYMISVWQNSHGRKFFPKFRFALSGHLSIARFKEAWEALVAETPVLRTTFVTADRSGIPFAQIILDRHYFLKEAAKDLDNDSSLSWKPQPLGRAMYALAAQRQDERTIIITLHIHHALYDAISLDAITRRLVDLCMQLQERPGFATERLQVDESLEWQRFVAMHSKHSHTEARRAFWVTYLTPSPKRPVPLMNALRSYGGQSSSIFKPSAFNVHTLKGLCNARGLSFQALFFACYARVLYSLANTHQLGTTEVDVVFGIYVANRSIAEEVAETGFPTLAILPLKVTMCASWDAWESAQRVQDDLKSITAPANATVALWEVATWTGLELQSFVNFLGRPESKSGESAGSTSISIRQITQSLESALSDLAQTAHGAVGEDILIELSSSTIRASYPVS